MKMQLIGYLMDVAKLKWKITDLWNQTGCDKCHFTV